jgi:hypothetical protein
VPHVVREVDRRHAALPELTLDCVAVGEGGGEAFVGWLHATKVEPGTGEREGMTSCGDGLKTRRYAWPASI